MHLQTFVCFSFFVDSLICMVYLLIYLSVHIYIYRHALNPGFSASRGGARRKHEWRVCLSRGFKDLKQENMGTSE